MSSEINPSAGGRRHLFGHRRARASVPGRVRWRRFALMFLPAAAVTAILLVVTANGALAVSFSISGQQGETSADSLTGTGFQQFGTADVTKGGTIIPVAESEISSAQITNLCQSLVESLPLGLGDVTLTIRGGTGGTPVSASSLIIDANQLGGSTATFNNIQEGIDAGSVSDATGMAAGTEGNFAQQATSISISNLQEVAYATSAGTLTLPGFSLSLTAGDSPCFAGGPVNSFNL
jgi:Family of unknown function (DUF6230)